MKRLLLLVFILAAASPAAAMLALPRAPAQAPQWTISVDAWIGKTHVRYKTAAWVYTPGPSYRARLYAVGPYLASDASNMAASFEQIVAGEPDAAVFNGGFWDSDPFVPAGLLLVDGYTVHQFDFAKNVQGDYGQSAVLCVGANGHVEALHTADFVAPTAHVATRCRSALQAGPFVVDNGQNSIHSLRDAAIRTILGFDAKGVPTLVVFQQPVHLLAAAEFLRGRSGSGHDVHIGNGHTPSGLQSFGGLGLATAVNLNGEAGVVCYYKGNRVAGYSTLAMPSAFSLRPN